ncbi:uncharacterized protein HGUI_00108 [Hanseniaspora guilliermondii]|uniref:Glucose-signaling factor 2 n=1 Tax=Hanseniaspora guilliermondii TaxID=56406 RepID=A0A1L0AW69_9ASCO|nr:uncharacterized protein HGUI_00108 [Hanseniaspora guilliermondii]
MSDIKENATSEETSIDTMEVYLRLKGDNEKDYLLTLPKKTPLKDTAIFSKELLNLNHSRLINEFKIVLKPTVFHKNTLSIINKSCHPGLLIREGSSIIYDYDADESEHLKPLDLQKSVEDQLWPHQLILPKWELDYFSIFTYITLMTVWLISDIPQYINPWKNKNLTHLLNLFFFKVFKYLEVDYLADLIEKDMIEVNSLNNDSSLILLWGIYFLHILKVVVITFFLKVGLINPPSFNPLFYYFKYFKEGETQKKSQLALNHYMASLGMNGIKRFNIDQYKNYVYSYWLKKADNDQVKAYKTGYFPYMKGEYVALKKGEGFDSNLEDRFTTNTFDVLEKENKFVLSEAYYQEVFKTMVSIMNSQDELAFINTLKDFKRFGINECPNETLNSIYLKRREIDEKKKE